MGARWSITTKRAVVAGLVVLAIVLLWRAGDIVQPFIWGLIVAYILLPVVGALERRFAVPRTLAALVVFVAMVAIIFGGSRLIIPRVAENAGDLQKNWPVLLANVQQTISNTFDQLGLSDLDDVLLLGVPYSVLLGVLTGLLETIPFVGPITAGALACLVALGHPNPFGWSQLIYVGVVAIMYTILRHAEDYLVIPTVIGRAVRLHPAIVIFSLLTGGAVFGLIGIVLAVPFAATLRLVLIYVGAKLRDEDPFPQLEVELAEATETPGEAIETTRAPGRARP